MKRFSVATRWVCLLVVLFFVGCQTAAILPAVQENKSGITTGMSRGEVLTAYGPPVLIHRDDDPKIEYLHYHVIHRDVRKGEDEVNQVYIAIQDGIVTRAGNRSDFDFNYPPAH